MELYIFEVAHYIYYEARSLFEPIYTPTYLRLHRLLLHVAPLKLRVLTIDSDERLPNGYCSNCGYSDLCDLKVFMWFLNCNRFFSLYKNKTIVRKILSWQKIKLYTKCSDINIET